MRYKAAKKGGDENLELSMLDENLDDDDAEYPDEVAAVEVETVDPKLDPEGLGVPDPSLDPELA